MRTQRRKLKLRANRAAAVVYMPRLDGDPRGRWLVADGADVQVTVRESAETPAHEELGGPGAPDVGAVIVVAPPAGTDGSADVMRRAEQIAATIALILESS